MAKVKSIYVCEACGAEAPRWQGKCSVCDAWNTLVEATEEAAGPYLRAALQEDARPTPITQGGDAESPRMKTRIAEFDRVLGGGVVPGSLVLVGGDPGIGKSTLMLQVAHRLAQDHGPVLYVSGEESFEQARLRARRLGTLHDRLLLLTETNLVAIQKHLRAPGLALAIVDSIQSIYTPHVPAVPGSVGQIRECAGELLRTAKGRHLPILLVGHVTKDGAIAGPRLLEHLVDTVLYFEGEGRQALRILRAVKNRFGSTNEIGVFEMLGHGLHEVPNPSARFLDERPQHAPGSVVTPAIEGSRPLLVEVQALVGDAHAGSPRRTITGVNPNRVNLLLAVLEKHAGLHLADRDVFVNVAGGVRLEEPAADLAVALAIASSFREKALPRDLAAFGEVGLAGEVRAVDQTQRRLEEVAKFGFARCLYPRAGNASLKSPAGMAPDGIETIYDAVEAAMEG
jgi:DNA repair protein RadA/Sms